MGKRFAILIGVAAAGVMAFGAQTAVAATDICVAANNAVRHQAGTATCAASGTGSVAIAKGAGSDATVGTFGGNHNRAMVRGDGSFAFAGQGDGNTATVTGDGSFASAGSGDNNTATVTGDGSTAGAGIGDNNIATVTGDGSTALAEHGDNNTATVTGDGCTAVAFGGGATDNVVCP